jgi:hypothetical protein
MQGQEKNMNKITFGDTFTCRRFPFSLPYHTHPRKTDVFMPYKVKELRKPTIPCQKAENLSLTTFLSPKRFMFPDYHFKSFMNL